MADLDPCLHLGADIAIDYRNPLSVVSCARPRPAGVDVHLDTSGQHDLDAAVGLLAPGGRIVLMAGLPQRPELPVGDLYTCDAQNLGFAIGNAPSRVWQPRPTGSISSSRTEHSSLAASKSYR